MPTDPRAEIVERLTPVQRGEIEHIQSETLAEIERLNCTLEWCSRRLATPLPTAPTSDIQPTNAELAKDFRQWAETILDGRREVLLTVADRLDEVPAPPQPVSDVAENAGPQSIQDGDTFNPFTGEKHKQTPQPEPAAEAEGEIGRHLSQLADIAQLLNGYGRYSECECCCEAATTLRTLQAKVDAADGLKEQVHCFRGLCAGMHTQLWRLPAIDAVITAYRAAGG